MLDKKITEYTSEELNEIRNQITEELAERSRKEREDTWREVVEALRKFTFKFGDIECNIGGDTFYIDKYFRYDIIGEIAQN